MARNLAVKVKDGIEDSAEADKISMSVGRVPNTEGLNLEAIGIAKNGSTIALINI